MLLPPICQQFCLSLCHCLLSCPSSCHHLSQASSPAGCCVASTHTVASDLPAPLPLIPPSPLVAPMPPVPHVQLVVMLPLLMLPTPICLQLCLSSCCCLMSCPTPCHCLSGLLSSWLLCCLSSCHHLPSAGNSASHCAVASCHAPLHAIAPCASSPAGCWVASPLMPLPPICQHFCLSSRCHLSLRHGLPCLYSG
jgi:hypothetical protein